MLEGERRIAALEACLAGARSEADSWIVELEARLARVPALVEAAKHLLSDVEDGGDPGRADAARQVAIKQGEREAEAA